VRTNNEDSFRILEAPTLRSFPMAWAAKPNGEVASSMAVETIVNYCAEAKDDPGITFSGAPGDHWAEKNQASAKRRVPGK